MTSSQAWAFPVPNSEDEIIHGCHQALCLAPSEYPPTLPTSKERLDAPEWYGFELAAWPIGERIRQALSKNPRFKKNIGVVTKILEVAICRNLRRGRQSFVTTLGFVAAKGHAQDLVPFLNDEDVDGQVVGTLLKMRAAGYGREVRPLLDSKQAWIKRLAKNYISRYPS
jgi:hypothetical protein